MDIYKIPDLIQFLKSRKLYLTKDRGQNFLIQKEFLYKIAECLPNDLPLIEIGPGVGHLSRILAEKTKDFTLVELDKGFVQILREELPSFVNIIHQDFLKYTLEKTKQYQVIGNIPYNITSKIVLSLLKQNESIDHFFLLMQKEAAERLMSKPSHKNYSVSSILVSFYTEAKVLFNLPPTCFFPAPNVQSVFVQFTPNKKPWNPDFFTFLQKCFLSRRKTIYNSLKQTYEKDKILKELNHLSLKEQERAENLTDETLFKLFSYLENL